MRRIPIAIWFGFVLMFPAKAIADSGKDRLTATTHQVQSTPGRYSELLDRRVSDAKASANFAGWAAIVSGGATLAASIPGYYLSDDLFAQLIYTLGQNVGVAAVAYGSYQVLIPGEEERFAKILASTPGLTAQNREDLARGFYRENAARARSLRWIRVISHGLSAGLNFMNAATTGHTELRLTLLFLGGINSLAAVGFGFKESEEERLYEEGAPLARGGWDIGVIVGSVSGVQLRF